MEIPGNDYILYIINGAMVICMSVGAFFVNDLNKKISQDRVELQVIVTASRLEVDKRLAEGTRYIDLKVHDNEKRIERLEEGQKDQDLMHAAYRENAAEKFVTRQELRDTLMPISGSLIRLEQKIDTWGHQFHSRRNGDD